MDRRAWWAAVHEVAQSRTQLKQLSMHAFIGEGNGNHSSNLPGESQRQRSLVGCCLWGHTESDMTEVTYQQEQQQPPFAFPSFYSSLDFMVHYCWHSFVCTSTLLPLEHLLGRASTIGQHNSLPTTFV